MINEYSPLFWLFLNFLTIVMSAFYSMQEMAAVSFNKVRLQYYVEKGNQRAVWLNYLLQNPSRLFGTTLIGVNITLVVGSECARQFTSSLGIDPMWSAIPQVIIIVIFGELAPMFAARNYPEHVAMLGIPLVYASAKLMSPLLWFIGLISKVCNYLIGGNQQDSDIYLSEEELQKALEEHADEPNHEEISERFISSIASNIFNIRKRTIRQIMEPINRSKILPSNSTVDLLRTMLKKSNLDYVPLYHENPGNIVSIVYPRDAIRAMSHEKIRNYGSSPWFVSEKTPILQLLKQFRSNNESVAVVLNENKKAVGLIHLQDILVEIFGKVAPTPNEKSENRASSLMLIDKTFPGEMTLGEFQNLYHVSIGLDPTMTLAELMEFHLGNHLEKGDSLYLPPFELTVKEVGILGVKSVSISTRE